MGVPGKVRKGGLGNLLGELRRADLAQCSRLDQVQMTTYERGEGFFRILLDVIAQQFWILDHSLIISPLWNGIRQK